jgi:hypothetical protein
LDSLSGMVIICISLFYIYLFGFPVSSRSLKVTSDEPLQLLTSYSLPARQCPYRDKLYVISSASFPTTVIYAGIEGPM